MGQVMITGKDFGNTINVSELPSGTYFITFYRRNQKPLRIKFIKQ